MTKKAKKTTILSWERVICLKRSQAFLNAYQILFNTKDTQTVRERHAFGDQLSKADILLLDASLRFREHKYRDTIELCRQFLQIEPENLAVALFLLYSITAIGASIEDFLDQPIAGWAANYPEFPLAVIDCAHTRGNEPLAYRVMSMLNFQNGNQDEQDALFRSSLAVFDRDTVDAHLQQNDPTVTIMDPFQSLLVYDQPEYHFSCALDAQGLSSEPRDRSSPKKPAISSRARLRVGYISPDFRMHPTTLLLWKMFELHDDHKFDIHLLSTLDPTIIANANELLRGGIDPWLDHFMAKSNFAVLPTQEGERETAVRALGLDLLIDLNGLARGGCQSLLRNRPARVQASYLGYPGTTGNPEIDYLIADDTVVHEGNRDEFTEDLVSLPGFYQINSYQYFEKSENYTREQFGLPTNKIVFCSFNATHKISGDVFDLWCEILKATPHSVLWLLRENDIQVDAMIKRANDQGVDHTRLIFAGKCDFSQHRSRLALADIMLDSFPYCGHTTAIDAAWSAVPCVTRYGQSFQSRVAMSMNLQLGLSELNCSDQKTYFEKATILAHDSEKLSEVKALLEKGKSTNLVYNTEKKTRELESIFFQIA